MRTLEIVRYKLNQLFGIDYPDPDIQILSDPEREINRQNIISHDFDEAAKARSVLVNKNMPPEFRLSAKKYLKGRGIEITGV